MRIPFTLRGIAGYVDVSITANTNPDAIGYSLLFHGSPLDFAHGFPVCRRSTRATRARERRLGFPRLTAS
jgi:hypothetical protein